MFDIFAKLLSSVASFLFPLFASYKALKTSDPAQLTPWLMYWVVLACGLLVESWIDWILVWIPFYQYVRLLFLLYLVLPQTQGARIIYQEHIHPYLEENETAIEDFIASAHDRLRSAGISYLKRAIELLKTNVLGLPPSEEPPSATSAYSSPSARSQPQSYTQSLLARFSLPNARWTGIGGSGASGNAAGAADFYNLLASAVSAVATGASGGAAASALKTGPEHGPGGLGGTATLIPENIQGTTARMGFIAAQREKLNILLSALEREATVLQREEVTRREARAPSISLDGSNGSGQEESPARPPSGLSGHSSGTYLSKSRSEADFEKLEAESGAEEDMEDTGTPGAGVRRRTPAATQGGGWMSWGWGAPTGAGGSDSGKSPEVEK